MGCGQPQSFDANPGEHQEAKGHDCQDHHTLTTHRWPEPRMEQDREDQPH